LILYTRYSTNDKIGGFIDAIIKSSPSQEGGGTDTSSHPTQPPLSTEEHAWPPPTEAPSAHTSQVTYSSLEGKESSWTLCEVLSRASDESVPLETFTDALLLTRMMPPRGRIRRPPPEPEPKDCVTNEKRIADVFLFGGGEVDTLEIRLLELYDVVDAIHPVVSNLDHKGGVSRDILSDLLMTPRFMRFADKVEVWHIEQELKEGDGTNAANFRLEDEKGGIAAKKAGERYGSETDPRWAVIFGHVDEIPRRADVWRIKRCEAQLPGNFAIWFPRGRLDTAYRSDWPAKGKPWSLGDPGMYWADGVGGLPRGGLPNVVGRGFHATDYCFPVYGIFKSVTATEGRTSERSYFASLGFNESNCEEMWRARTHACHTAFMPDGQRYKQVDPAGSDDDFRVPWALCAMPERYPAWRGGVDGRLGDHPMLPSCQCPDPSCQHCKEREEEEVYTFNPSASDIADVTLPTQCA